eukprot:1175649-Prorocentrum_minimum.AAC.2
MNSGTNASTSAALPNRMALMSIALRLCPCCGRDCGTTCTLAYSLFDGNKARLSVFRRWLALNCTSLREISFASLKMFRLVQGYLPDLLAW